MKNEVKIVGTLRMKTVQAIIDHHGGMEALKENHIKIENEPYLKLFIEWVGSGPYDTELVSVAHYYTQNGDIMRDPEIVFHVSKMGDWTPMTFQQDSLGIYQEAVSVREGSFLINPKLVRDLTKFARTWDRNIRLQGFLDLITK